MIIQKAKPLVSGFRYVVFIFFIIGLFGLLIARLIYIYYAKSDFYAKQGDIRTIKQEIIPAQRGIIRDANGEILALTTVLVSVGIDLELLRIKSDMSSSEKRRAQERIDKFSRHIEFVAKVSGREVKWLEEIIFVPNRYKFRNIVKNITPEKANVLKEKNIPALVYKRTLKRFYPQGEILANVIGFSDYRDSGRSGIEAAFDDFLGGESGKGWVRKDRQGNVISNISEYETAERGKDLRLSIDRRIQEISFFALKKAYLKYKAASAGAIVLNSKTGEIIALANLPSYNPNDNSQRVGAGVRNVVINDLWEPGSVVKPFTVLAGLESGVITPNSSFNLGQGKYKTIKVADRIYKDPVAINDSPLNLKTLIKKSSNAGAVKIALKFDKKTFRSYLNLFGFGQKTGAEFPGDKAGVLNPYKNWGLVDKASAAIGYGLSSSVAQIARSYTIFANKGRLMPLSIVKLRNTPRGLLVAAVNNADTVKNLMTHTVIAGGTATHAKVSGFKVAGKSGTVKKYINGKYSLNRHHVFFAGLAPVENPRIVVAVMVNDPKGKRHGGGLVAGTVFSEIVSKTLAYYGVLPQENIRKNILARFERNR